MLVAVSHCIFPFPCRCIGECSQRAFPTEPVFPANFRKFIISTSRLRLSGRQFHSTVYLLLWTKLYRCIRIWMIASCTMSTMDFCSRHGSDAALPKRAILVEDPRHAVMDAVPFVVHARPVASEAGANMQRRTGAAGKRTEPH